MQSFVSSEASRVRSLALIATQRNDTGNEDYQLKILDAPPEKPFRFADLPYEIRVMIYKLVLLGNGPIELWPRVQPDEDGSNSNVGAFRGRITFYKKRITPTLKLLRFNKCINAEAAEVFYEENEFRFSNNRGFIVLQRFLDTIGPANAARLRHVAVHVPFAGEYHDNEGNPLTDADNLCDSISNMDSLWAFLRSANLRVPIVRQKLNMWCAVKRVCSMLARSESRLQLSLVVPFNFYISGLCKDYGNGAAAEYMRSLPVSKNRLGWRPYFDTIAWDYQDVKVSLVFLGWPSDASPPNAEIHRQRYIEAHKQIMQRAADANWDIREATTRYCGSYRILPFNSFRFDDPEAFHLYGANMWK